ncbi:MAG: histidinol dehydrogenase, partial [Planctomycetota bacterium]|nr:histidinol dehydrogenase [Planctomycetota bacterium]
DVLSRPVESTPFVDAFRRAAERIRRFHSRVAPRSTYFEDEDGIRLGLRWTPVEAVGLYIPGGKASYPSTLAMTAIPAQIAGAGRIAVVSPPGPDGEVSEQVLLAARVLGIREVYRVGGAQAIAALALGTASVPRVDKIFGPGNAFVAEAKKQLFGEVGIDLLAGPSEIVIYADETAEPDWVASDLMAQAEHDEDTRVTLLASSAGVLDAVRTSLEERVKEEPRRSTIEAALARGGSFEVCESSLEAARRINEIAPEHLALQVAEPWQVLAHVRNAGAIFLGKESPVAFGDYYAGPNHVLPTGRAARYASCLSVEDFMKRSNLAHLNLEFVRRRAADVEELARGEGLPAHATSVRLRRASDRRPRARRGLRSVTPYALVDEEGDVKLNQNESPWDIPGEIKDEVARRLRDLAWNRYHQKLPGELQERIGADVGLPPEAVVVATGSNLLLQWIFAAYGGPGATVLRPTPSFSLYPLWTDVTEARGETVPLGSDFQYDAAAFVERIGALRPEITVLCLPNNPTGGEMEPGDVRRVAEAAAVGGGLLVVDEAYREFSDPRYDRTALARELDNVILVRTCSKAFSAAGVRLGYLLSPPDVARELRKLVPPFHLSLFSAVLGLVLWERKELFRERTSQLRDARDRLMQEVSRMSGAEVFPSQANFFLFRVPEAERVFEALRGRGILVRRLWSDAALEDCLRVNAGTPEENERFLGALREVLG